MKTAIIGLLSLVIAMSSCTTEYDVQLKNGSVVRAVDVQGRSYRDGEKVCIEAPSSYGEKWKVDDRGNMEDTIILIQDYDTSTNKTWIVQRKIGTIKL